MQYSIFKFLHVLGVILLIGNVTITAFWKVFADRSNDPRVIAEAQRIVILADWFFTASGIVLIVVGGYGMLFVAGLSPFDGAWLVWGQILFLVSGVIWVAVLVPAQIRQARAAKTLKRGSPIPPRYWADGRLWLAWGIAATIPLVAAVYVMIVKPWGSERAMNKNSRVHATQALRAARVTHCRVRSAEPAAQDEGDRRSDEYPAPNEQAD
jgi:uncharacterized membrane protein